MKKFISQLRSAWHHGKGSKYTRRGNFKLALNHFQAALKYSMLSDNEASVPLEMECVARTLVRLGEYEQAKKYADESLILYKKLHGPIFDDGAKRISELLTIVGKEKGDRLI